jgi:hypothetical protein
LKATQDWHFVFGVKKVNIMLQYFHFSEKFGKSPEEKN